MKNGAFKHDEPVAGYGVMTGIRFSADVGMSLLHRVQTDPEVHRASYPIVPGVKQPKREADNSSSSSDEVKKASWFISTPPPPFVL
jgi:hypothetical protein